MLWRTLDKIRCQMRQYKCNANRWWRKLIRTWSPGIRGMVINMVTDVRKRSNMSLHILVFPHLNRDTESHSQPHEHGSAADMWQHFQSQSRDHGDQWCQRFWQVNKSNEAVCILSLHLSAVERSLLKVLCGTYGVKALEQNIMTLSSLSEMPRLFPTVTPSLMNCDSALSSFEQWFDSYTL